MWPVSNLLSPILSEFAPVLPRGLPNRKHGVTVAGILQAGCEAFWRPSLESSKTVNSQFCVSLPMSDAQNFRDVNVVVQNSNMSLAADFLYFTVITSKADRCQNSV